MCPEQRRRVVRSPNVPEEPEEDVNVNLFSQPSITDVDVRSQQLDVLDPRLGREETAFLAHFHFLKLTRVTALKGRGRPPAALYPQERSLTEFGDPVSEINSHKVFIPIKSCIVIT